MAEHDSDAEWLERLLLEWTVVRAPRIGPETEVYYDLRISGDDLEEVVTAAASRCGAPTLQLPPGRYAPGEPGDWFDWLFKRPDHRRYQSLTVAMLLEAMARTRSIHR